MGRALERRVRRLEASSPDTASGLVVIPAGSPDGEAALLLEADRRGEMGRADLVVVVKRFAAGASAYGPTRSVAGHTRPILAGFVEPAGTPWLATLDGMEPAGRA